MPKIKEIPVCEGDYPIVQELTRLPNTRRVPVVPWEPDTVVNDVLAEMECGWILRPKKGKHFIKNLVPCMLNGADSDTVHET